MDRLFLPNRDGSDGVFVDQAYAGDSGDKTPPFLAGELQAISITAIGFTLVWPAASGDVVSYEVTLDGGLTWGDVGNVLAREFGGRQPLSTYQTGVRARDAAFNYSGILSRNVKTLALDVPPEEIETAARFARPYADVTAGTWLPSQPGAKLASMIDEPNASSSDFIYAAEPGYCEIRLGPVKDPESSAGQKVRYQLWDEGAGAMTVMLMQGVAVIAQWHHPALPTVPTELAQTLTAAQCDSISDYSDLRLRFVAV